MLVFEQLYFNIYTFILYRYFMAQIKESALMLVTSVRIPGKYCTGPETGEISSSTDILPRPPASV